MIAKISGKIDFIDDTSLIVQTSTGIGYQVFIFNTQKYNLGEEIELYTFHKQTEKDDSLWGFNLLNELMLAKILMGVNGIGIKIAQSLVLNFGFEIVTESIINGDFKSISMSGVGPKTTQKIINELKDKDSMHNFAKRFINSKNQNNIKQNSSTKLDEAIGALESLGFNSKDIYKHINEVSSEYEFKEMNTQEIIKLLLRFVNKK